MAYHSRILFLIHPSLSSVLQLHWVTPLQAMTQGSKLCSSCVSAHWVLAYTNGWKRKRESMEYYKNSFQAMVWKRHLSLLVTFIWPKLILLLCLAAGSSEMFSCDNKHDVLVLAPAQLPSISIKSICTGNLKKLTCTILQFSFLSLYSKNAFFMYH